MVEVLLVSNGEIKDIEKIKEIIKNLGDDFFIQSNITTIPAENLDEQCIDYDFAVTLDSRVHLSKKTIDVTPILLNRSGEKAEKDIQNQLLKAKATHKRQKESKGR